MKLYKIKKSNIDKKGLYATKDIKVGTRIIQYKGKIDSVISSNTPKAIIFSAATTMGSFSTLAISSHSGTSSMGLLLFICLLMTVLSAVFILPVLLSSFKFLIK